MAKAGHPKRTESYLRCKNCGEEFVHLVTNYGKKLFCEECIEEKRRVDARNRYRIKRGVEVMNGL